MKDAHLNRTIINIVDALLMGVLMITLLISA